MSSPTCRGGWESEALAASRQPARDPQKRHDKHLAPTDTSIMTKTGIRAWGPAISLLLISCSTSAQPAKRLAPGDVVATVGPVSITLAEVDDKALQQPAGSFGEVKLAQAL